jgi:surfeit locus 1 family protein
MTTERARFPWALTIVCALLLALLLALGTWQLRRLAWKEGLIAQAEAASAAPPAPLPNRPGPLPAFSRVILDCDFEDGGRRLVELQTILDGRPGVRLLSACGDRIVDLGFVDEATSERPGPTEFRPGSPTETRRRIVAVVREAAPPGPMAPPARDGRFYARDNAAIAEVLNVPAANAGQTLYAVDSAFPDFPGLEPSAPPAAFSNNHLGYALTWFGLAIALVGFYVALLRRRLRK